eukprot:ANDGO_03301.mRNA.1 hypothetical protein H696_01075
MLPDRYFHLIVAVTSTFATIAGYMNGAAIILVSHGVSHVTGITSTLADQAVVQSSDGVLRNVLLLFSFMFGSFLAGVIVPSQSFAVGHKYNLAIGIEAGMVAGAAFLLNPSYDLWTRRSGEYLLSGACGLQNALITTYSKAIIRTTHMTGIVSDIGAIFGQIARKEYGNVWKLRIFIPIYFSFLIGSAFGGAAAVSFPMYCLYIPALILGGMSFAYMTYRTHQVARRMVRAHRERRKLRRSQSAASVDSNMSDMTSTSMDDMSQSQLDISASATQMDLQEVEASEIPVIQAPQGPSEATLRKLAKREQKEGLLVPTDGNFTGTGSAVHTDDFSTSHGSVSPAFRSRSSASGSAPGAASASASGSGSGMGMGMNFDAAASSTYTSSYSVPVSASSENVSYGSRRYGESSPQRLPVSGSIDSFHHPGSHGDTVSFPVSFDTDQTQQV